MTHYMKRYPMLISVVGMIIGVWMVIGTSASADLSSDQILVRVTPERVSTSVGTAVEVTVTLVNNTPDPTPELAIHLDITDPRLSGSVDPEDWTSTLTRSTSVVESGQQVTVSWTIIPIGPGDFVLYATALDVNAGVEPGMIAVSNGVPVHVERKRSFNPEGVLPIAVTIPAVIGVTLLWRYRRLRLQ